MLNLLPSADIYLVAGVTDMRKSYNGLSAIVENELKKSVTDGQVFCFCNRRKNRIKLLWFDSSGLWVAAKRLEGGTFAWPKVGTRSVELSANELTLLLGGIDLRQARPRRWYRRGART